MSGSSLRRLDQLLVERGLAPSRTRAQAWILAGAVYVDGRRRDKAGTPVPADAVIEVRAPAERYVSRAGLKLEHALAVFALEPAGWTVVDIGASTGGFTDCWLQHGAARVYAVDVGRGQLDWRLRQDPRVVVRERTNARYLSLAALGRQEPVEAVSVDVSFIGLARVLPAARGLLAPGGHLLALLKPQFEAGPRRVGKGGVVRDPAVHEAVLREFLASLPAMGLAVAGATPSPIRGGDGNIEFFFHLVPDVSWERDVHASAVNPAALVEEAWQGRRPPDPGR
ncbi:putative 2'-O-ribose RNA methyltransferase [Candidatus Hydrogenisulfobacillus filiaventi]|uniref:Putative 2'-O-ribose RNA methyltransferase n=1 Tax=Candidatus Hydrogenisulfobacillus filiaventi TaxID=2707344 RepID=A0A6F8ZG91_9FIRM|nr:TlyA family RNA methyltransferase [Bacillota bacterium]CAB1128656.1 putative 2'-O-ribose RNA methyltransferase [Candidatus Hydrogenisulfobacillus filiaventi]